LSQATVRRKPEKQLPLKDRKVRVRLLLASYLDAVIDPGSGPQDKRDGVSGDPATSREPRRNRELWREGSYRRLERALDELRQWNRAVYRDTWDCHVLRDYSINGARQARAHLGVALIALAMPSSIYVPTSISENAGYEPSDAKQYARKDALHR
jgi:hypothetical protein